MNIVTHAHEMRAIASPMMQKTMDGQCDVSTLTIKTEDDRDMITLIFRHITADQLQSLADEFNVIIAIGKAAAQEAGQ